jgi:LPXTG-motif cell wall-anchored protein
MSAPALIGTALILAAIGFILLKRSRRHVAA